MKRLLQSYLSLSAECRPHAVALVMGDRRLTFGQLEAATNQFARLLKTAGCSRRDRVCIVAQKSPEAIIAILGSLKADCVYVPVDAANPAARIAKIIHAGEPRVVVADSKIADKLPAMLPASAVIWIGERDHSSDRPGAQFSLGDAEAYSGAPLDANNHPEDPAHILFTSGSTGTPKGVVIKHANVTAFVDWGARYFGVAAGDRVSCHPPLHFDLSGFDIYGSLAAGAELHLVPAETSLLPHKLAEFIRKSELTQWFSVPAVLNYLAQANAQLNFPALRHVLWCGEVLPVPALIYWMKRLPWVSFTNLYGPTETTIASSYHTLPSCPTDERASIPIGRPCPGEQLFVLDQDFKSVPPAEVGELYVGGVGLSLGYWRDPEKTQSVFVQNPRTGQRLYRTGDLAKVGPDGLVYFVGRTDSQIKHCGYRIELGEIESALAAMGWFSECAVVAIGSEGFEGTVICCAYVPGAGSSDHPAVICRELGRTVPGYMVPSRWRRFSMLPKNVNGKIDRPALRMLFQREGREAAA